MITGKELVTIHDKLINDESFCRLLYYGVDPFNESKSDVTGMTDYKDILKTYIRYFPQTDDLDKSENVKINMYKQYSKISEGISVVRLETIQFDIYVPHRINGEELRTYQLEDKISNLLDGMPMGLGCMYYMDGTFIPITGVIGYTQYKMVFLVKEGRLPNARF